LSSPAKPGFQPDAKEFILKVELANYDIFPKVVLAHERVSITIKPLGDHAFFPDTTSYTLTVAPMNDTNMNDKARNYPVYNLRPQEGALVFTHQFGDEGQYNVVIDPVDKGPEPPSMSSRPAGLRRHELRVYAVEADLYKLRPFRGDVHVHTHRSDGQEAPAIVAANYRKAGFDFLSISDHRFYEPSREAIDAYRGVDIDLGIFTGEEVHPPENNTHYIHFGGDYSVNAVFRGEPERYKREVGEIMKTLEVPPGINKGEYASCLWVCREIRRARGLSVMVHPHWVSNYTYHIPEKMIEYMLRSKPFDAFELIGGQALRENAPQIALWQQLRAEGRAIPVMGNSDSHGTVGPGWFNIAKTIVLAERIEKETLIAAIRDERSVALEQYAGEPLPRLYGSYRYVMFVLFLLEEYFPLHDELCFEEGRLMKDYVTGDKSAAEVLQRFRGRCGALIKKYWGSQG
jgi:hypothetical protein